jgi:DNA-binding PadR family transcriptional regulator
MIDQNDVQGNLPLSEVTFFILLSLASEPKHGYAIIKDVHELSKARVTLSTGTLYGALKRLLAQGWIARLSEMVRPAASAIHPGRPRKAYTLTDLGRRILNAEIGRLHALIAVARLRTAEEQV